jgi:DmsE family decaheme c-type cytochrome
MGNKCPKSAARMGATWGGDVDKRNGGRRAKRASLIAQALVLAALFGFAEQAKAEPGQSLSLDQVRSAVTGAIGTDTQNFHGEIYRDDTYSALRQYVQEIRGGDQMAELPQAASGVVQGDDAYEALLGFVQTLPSERPIVLAAATKPIPVKKVPAGGNEATYIGSQTCLKCHSGVAAEYAKTLMGRISKTQKGKLDCEGCHGPGSAHVAAGGGRGVGGINGFRPQTPQQVEQNNGICLACHEKGKRTAWAGSTHEERGLACTNCHSVMSNVTPKANLVKSTTPEVCYQCHKLQRAQMQRSSHMPVREGKITCTNCHNPHGSVYGTEAMLDAPTINDNCYKCHAEKRGPLLWEHAPVRENCLNCHEAHGSNHEFLLKVQRPRLCAECHAFAHGGQGSQGARVSTAYTVGHSCNNCHTQIHGSNHPSGAFFQR